MKTIPSKARLNCLSLKLVLSSEKVPLENVSVSHLLFFFLSLSLSPHPSPVSASLTAKVGTKGRVALEKLPIEVSRCQKINEFKKKVCFSWSFPAELPPSLEESQNH